MFITEALLAAARLIQAKYGWPPWFFNYMMDIHHTPHYAVGYLMKQIQPRIGMVTHMQFERDLLNEIMAGIRYHWDGLFAFGALDLVVVNVTKDAIWVRDAVIPQMSGTARPTTAQRYGTTDLPHEVEVPQPRMPREKQQHAYLREIEIDPKEYYPPDVYRDPVTELSDPIKVDPKGFWVSDE